MAGMEQAPEEVLDLLVKELTEGLTPEEQRILAAAPSAATDDYRRDLERAAAAVSLAAAPADAEPLPGALRDRLEREAKAYFAAQAAPAANDGGRASPSVANVIPLQASPANRAGSAPDAGDYRRRAPAAGWWAAAACLLLALYSWYRTPQTVFMPVETAQREVPAPTPEMQRAALLARADTLKIPLGATKDPGAAGVSGDVVWDSQSQRGYLRLVGLRHNDPSTQQYQMWIFDRDRDPRYPVDGGVFDAPADGREIVVPIHNVIPIHNAKAFAVTVEKAGGVVVSARDHVIALAQTT